MKSSLASNIHRQLHTMKGVDILVGVPSFNNEKTILGVLKTVDKGLSKYFPDSKSVIMVSDGNSTDSTLDIAFDKFKSKSSEKVCTTYRGFAGKGMALRAIMEAARILKSKVLLLFDADLKSINPEWIRDLGRPLLDGKFDFITPYYVRDYKDGTITNLITYPLTRALYGQRLRQPIGGDFGMRSPLVKYFLDWAYWDNNVSRFGIDIWMTTIAANESFRTGQCFLGVKDHDSRRPDQLGPMFRQVLSTSFKLMERYCHKWEMIKESREVPFVNEPYDVKPPKLAISKDDYFEIYMTSSVNLMKIWKDILKKDTFSALKKATAARVFSATLWTRIVYDFACVYHRWKKDRFKLVGLITPFYYARLDSFLKECEELNVDEAVKRQAEIFEKNKSYLIKNWED
ncbi:glycosyltransferase [bacterium]|nr:glycosyltransferase [bacterium]MBU3954908.1 glycosyltransferase [bacterium]MBU4133919.1 glycosyltransferase [bacterium]